MRHQSPVRSRARSEYFYARAVRVQLHTRVFLKFKSSCTVCPCSTSLLLASNNICLYFQKSSDMLNKNTLDVKKVRRQSEAALQIGMCDQKL